MVGRGALPRAEDDDGETPATSSQASSAVYRERFRRQRRSDTQPELALRRALHARGLRYRVGLPVPGCSRRTIDVAFPRARLAVFVDGCFWHACPEHGTSPRANGRWWQDKLSGNVARDRDTDQHLLEVGWRVVRVWEHEPVEDALARVLGALRPDGDGAARVAPDQERTEP